MKRKYNSSGTGEGDEDAKKRKKSLSGKIKKGSFEHRFERKRYLNQLAQEFRTTLHMDYKQQTLANLANFAYDSYNYNFFLEIGIMPIFLAEISVNRDPTLTEFAMAGICNCAADNRMQREILKHDGFSLVKQQTFSTSTETVLSSVTILTYLISDNIDLHDQLLNDTHFFNHLTNLSSTHHDKRLKNVVSILIDLISSKKGI